MSALICFPQYNADIGKTLDTALALNFKPMVGLEFSTSSNCINAPGH